MDSFTLSIVLGLCWVVFVAGLVVGLQRWAFRPELDDRAAPEALTLDEEIAATRRRVEALEEPGGGAEWLTGLLLWRSRRCLTELCRRRQRLLAAEKRWLTRAKGVRLASWRDGFRS